MYSYIANSVLNDNLGQAMTRVIQRLRCTLETHLYQIKPVSLIVKILSEGTFLLDVAHICKNIGFPMMRLILEML